MTRSSVASSRSRTRMNGSTALRNSASDFQMLPRPAPSLPRPVDVPRAIHSHVRVQVYAAFEFDDQMFARSNDLLDLASLERHAIELGEHGLESPDRFAGERAVQRPRDAQDGVA